MSSSKFPTEYAIIADIPVTLTVDPRKLTRSPAKRTFKSPDEIFTYDDKEEKRIVEEFGGRGTGTGTAVTETGTAVTKSTPKSVPKSISPPVRPEVKNSPPPTTEDIIGKLTDRVKNVSLTKVPLTSEVSCIYDLCREQRMRRPPN